MKTVSIIIPCYNEERYIGRCLDSILDNTYPTELLEILIMDGLSTDNTRDIVGQFQEKYSNLKLIDNPGRSKPKALNIGIKNACGDILMRMDAHALYDKNYILECITALDKYGADNVGGVRKTLPGNESVIGKSIAYSLGHKFAVGNANYRTGVAGPTASDVVFLFCCRKELFDRVGLFDERLVRGQDREFNLRLKKMGCKMLIIPTAVSYYYARHSLRKFVHWIFIGGMVPVIISRITANSLFSWRNFVPPLFLLLLVILLVLSFVSWLGFIALLTILFVYAGVAIFFSYPIAKQEGSWSYLLSMPIVFFLTHVAYGAGFFAGFFKKFAKDPCA